MRILIFALLLILNFSNPLLSQEILKGERLGKTINPKDVYRVNVRIYIDSVKQGKYVFKGYILFFDRNNQTCVIHSNAKFYIWIGDGMKPSRAKTALYEYYKELHVSPSKFKVMKLQTGEIVTGMPLAPFTTKYQANKYDQYGGVIETGTPPFKYYWEPENSSRKFFLTFRPGGYRG